MLTTSSDHGLWSLTGARTAAFVRFWIRGAADVTPATATPSVTARHIHRISRHLKQGSGQGGRREVTTGSAGRRVRGSGSARDKDMRGAGQ